MITNKSDLSAPTCNDCHGNHGAAPPGVSSVVNVCGQCHAVNAELFNKSGHSKIFGQMGIPGCATCHSNHAIFETSDAMLSTGDKSACKLVIRQLLREQRSRPVCSLPSIV